MYKMNNDVSIRIDFNEVPMRLRASRLVQEGKIRWFLHGLKFETLKIVIIILGKSFDYI